MPNFLDKMRAVLRRDLLTAIRYRSGFALTIAGAVVELAAFFYLSRAIGPGFRPDGVDYFSFLLVGTGLYTFLVMSVNSFLSTVQEAQQTGTLEVLMTTATPPSTLVFLGALSALARNMIQLLIYLVAGVWVFRAHPQINLPGCLLMFVFTVLIAAAFGILAAAIQLAIQKGAAVVWLLGSGLWFLTGTLFPVSSLPEPLRIVSGVIPITYLLDGMRLALLEGARFARLAPDILALAGFSIVLLPLSLMVFAWTLRRARLLGTLSYY
jgi:ABC-2 type transport system permease protein